LRLKKALTEFVKQAKKHFELGEIKTRFFGFSFSNDFSELKR